jgi:biopolymer transport protein ExbD
LLYPSLYCSVDNAHYPSLSYNVLGAYSNRDTSLITITNEDYVNSDTIVELLININNAHSDSKVTLVMDNARYQRCNKVMDKAKELGIHLLFCLLIHRT